MNLFSEAKPFELIICFNLEYGDLPFNRMHSWKICLLLYFLIVRSAAELKVTVKHKHKQQQQLATYNHTLATILVQYASAVRYILNCIVGRLKIWFYTFDKLFLTNLF